MASRLPPRYLWVIFYVALNVGYTLAIVFTGRLFGESSNVPLHQNTPVVLIGFLVCASYVLISVFAFQILDHLISVRTEAEEDSGSWEAGLGPLVMALQLLFMAYFLYTGTYVAGSSSRDASILSAAWVLIPIDIIFLTYYGIRGRGAWARSNMILWVVSGLIRGWTGAILTLIFIESCRSIRNGTMRPRAVALVAVTILVLYPPVYYAKLLYRFAGSEGLVTFVTTFDASTISTTFESIGVSEAMAHSFQRVLDRLQVTSSAAVAYQASPALEAGIAGQRIFPAWLEGIHGIGLFRSLGVAAPIDLGQAMARHIDPTTYDSNWNSNPTFVGYMFATPFPSSLIVILYAATLCGASVILMRLLKWNEDTKDILWYAWLVYLIPGWFGAFFLFVYSLLLLLAIKTFLQIIARIRAGAVTC